MAGQEKKQNKTKACLFITNFMFNHADEFEE